MKKRLLISIVFVVITTLIIYGCSSAKGISTYENKTICSNYSTEPVSELPIGLIRDMLETYNTIQLQAIKDKEGMNDARAIAFDLETLKKFIYHIEAISKNTDSTISDKDIGIRIYYASYPERDKWESPKYNNELDDFIGDPITEQYGKKHTLVIMPTIKRNETYFDFNPKDERTYKKQFQEIKADENGLGYYSNPNNSTVSLSLVSRSSLGSRGSTVAQNHGGLFPPYPEDGMGFTN